MPGKAGKNVENSLWQRWCRARSNLGERQREILLSVPGGAADLLGVAAPTSDAQRFVEDWREWLVDQRKRRCLDEGQEAVPVQNRPHGEHALAKRLRRLAEKFQAKQMPSHEARCLLEVDILKAYVDDFCAAPKSEAQRFVEDWRR